MHRCIATSVQRRDSNISTIWDMVDDGVGILPSVFFELLLGITRKTANSLLGEWAEQRQRWTSSGLAKTSRRENKSGDTVELESRRDLAMATPRKGFSFL
jgi:hypothetical protein